MAEPPHETEHPTIRASLEVEQLDPNLYRSISLYTPFRARGVFGGQVISQAVVAATNCVESAFSLHSLHCYFLLSASTSAPILYHVERLRNGRSYTTRAVKAKQDGKLIFVLLCSFQRPEPWQPRHQWPVPADVAPPDACETWEERILATAAGPGVHPRKQEIMRGFAEQREGSNVAVKCVRRQDGSYPSGPNGCFDHTRVDGEGNKIYLWWMKAKDPPTCDAPYQKAMLGYVSDVNLIGCGASTLALERFARGPEALTMMSSLDHTIYYYSDNFDCGEWMLYVVTTYLAGSGRAMVNGRMYQDGSLIAVMTQEGVVRSGTRPRQEESQAKL